MGCGLSAFCKKSKRGDSPTLDAPIRRSTSRAPPTSKPNSLPLSESPHDEQPRPLQANIDLPAIDEESPVDSTSQLPVFLTVTKRTTQDVFTDRLRSGSYESHVRKDSNFTPSYKDGCQEDKEYDEIIDALTVEAGGDEAKVDEQEFNDNDEKAATKIQASFRGFRTRRALATGAAVAGAVGIGFFPLKKATDDVTLPDTSTKALIGEESNPRSNSPAVSYNNSRDSFQPPRSVNGYYLLQEGGEASSSDLYLPESNDYLVNEPDDRASRELEQPISIEPGDDTDPLINDSDEEGNDNLVENLIDLNSEENPLIPVPVTELTPARKVEHTTEIPREDEKDGVEVEEIEKAKRDDVKMPANDDQGECVEKCFGGSLAELLFRAEDPEIETVGDVLRAVGFVQTTVETPEAVTNKTELVTDEVNLNEILDEPRIVSEIPGVPLSVSTDELEQENFPPVAKPSLTEDLMEELEDTQVDIAIAKHEQMLTTPAEEPVLTEESEETLADVALEMPEKGELVKMDSLELIAVDSSHVDVSLAIRDQTMTVPVKQPVLTEDLIENKPENTAAIEEEASKQNSVEILRSSSGLELSKGVALVSGEQEPLEDQAHTDQKLNYHGDDIYEAVSEISSTLKHEVFVPTTSGDLDGAFDGNGVQTLGVPQQVEISADRDYEGEDSLTTRKTSQVIRPKISVDLEEDTEINMDEQQIEIASTENMETESAILTKESLDNYSSDENSKNLEEVSSSLSATPASEDIEDLQSATICQELKSEIRLVPGYDSQFLNTGSTHRNIDGMGETLEDTEEIQSDEAETEKGSSDGRVLVGSGVILAGSGKILAAVLPPITVVSSEELPQSTGDPVKMSSADHTNKYIQHASLFEQSLVPAKQIDGESLDVDQERSTNQIVEVPNIIQDGLQEDGNIALQVEAQADDNQQECKMLDILTTDEQPEAATVVTPENSVEIETHSEQEEPIGPEHLGSKTIDRTNQQTSENLDHTVGPEEPSLTGPQEDCEEYKNSLPSTENDNEVAIIIQKSVELDDEIASVILSALSDEHSQRSSRVVSKEPSFAAFEEEEETQTKSDDEVPCSLAEEDGHESAENQPESVEEKKIVEKIDGTGDFLLTSDQQDNNENECQVNELTETSSGQSVQIEISLLTAVAQEPKGSVNEYISVTEMVSNVTEDCMEISGTFEEQPKSNEAINVVQPVYLESGNSSLAATEGVANDRSLGEVEIPHHILPTITTNGSQDEVDKEVADIILEDFRRLSSEFSNEAFVPLLIQTSSSAKARPDTDKQEVLVIDMIDKTLQFGCCEGATSELKTSPELDRDANDELGPLPDSLENKNLLGRTEITITADDIDEDNYIWRKIQGHHSIDDEESYVKAATKIQATYRGYSARRQLRETTPDTQVTVLSEDDREKDVLTDVENSVDEDMAVVSAAKEHQDAVEISENVEVLESQILDQCLVQTELSELKFSTETESHEALPVVNHLSDIAEATPTLKACHELSEILDRKIYQHDLQEMEFGSKLLQEGSSFQDLCDSKEENSLAVAGDEENPAVIQEEFETVVSVKTEDTLADTLETLDCQRGHPVLRACDSADLSASNRSSLQTVISARGFEENGSPFEKSPSPRRLSVEMNNRNENSDDLPYIVPEEESSDNDRKDNSIAGTSEESACEQVTGLDSLEVQVTDDLGDEVLKDLQDDLSMVESQEDQLTKLTDDMPASNIETSKDCEDLVPTVPSNDLALSEYPALKDEVQDVEEEAAAGKIQAAFRGHQARKDLNEPEGDPCSEIDEEKSTSIAAVRVEVKRQWTPGLEEEEQAAVKIQAAFRGHQTRKGFPTAAIAECDAIDIEDFDKREGIELGSFKISLEEGVAGKQLTALHEQLLAVDSNDAAAHLTESAEMEALETTVLEEEAAATIIQAAFRGHQARRDLRMVATDGTVHAHNPGEEVISVAKKVEEDDPSPKEYFLSEVYAADLKSDGEQIDFGNLETEEEAAAVKIQTAFRGHQARKNLGQVKAEGFDPTLSDVKDNEAGGKIRTTWSNQLSIVDNDDAALYLTAVIEKKDFEVTTLEEEAAATMIQAAFRGHQARRDLQMVTTDGMVREHNPGEDVIDVAKEDEPSSREVGSLEGYADDLKSASKQMDTDTDLETEEEAAAVKIQSAFRVHQSRKNMGQLNAKDVDLTQSDVKDNFLVKPKEDAVILVTREDILVPDIMLLSFTPTNFIGEVSDDKSSLTSPPLDNAQIPAGGEEEGISATLPSDSTGLHFVVSNQTATVESYEAVSQQASACHNTGNDAGEKVTGLHQDEEELIDSQLVSSCIVDSLPLNLHALDNFQFVLDAVSESFIPDSLEVADRRPASGTPIDSLDVIPTRHPSELLATQDSTSYLLEFDPDSLCVDMIHTDSLEVLKVPREERMLEEQSLLVDSLVSDLSDSELRASEVSDFLNDIDAERFPIPLQAKTTHQKSASVSAEALEDLQEDKDKMGDIPDAICEKRSLDKPMDTTVSMLDETAFQMDDLQESNTALQGKNHLSTDKADFSEEECRFETTVPVLEEALPASVVTACHDLDEASTGPGIAVRTDVECENRVSTEKSDFVEEEFPLETTFQTFEEVLHVNIMTACEDLDEASAGPEIEAHLCNIDQTKVPETVTSTLVKLETPPANQQTTVSEPVNLISLEPDLSDVVEKEASEIIQNIAKALEEVEFIAHSYESPVYEKPTIPSRAKLSELEDSLIQDLDSEDGTDNSSDWTDGEKAHDLEDISMDILNHAATKIQAQYRGFRTRMRMKRQKYLQNHPRREEASNEPTRQETQGEARVPDLHDFGNCDELNIAATKIQAGVRGFLVRKAMRTWREQRRPSGAEGAYTCLRRSSRRSSEIPLIERRTSDPPLKDWSPVEFSKQMNSMHEVVAATVIQAYYRGYKARRHLRPSRKVKSADCAMEDQAATKIQAAFRGYKTRKDLGVPARPTRTKKTQHSTEDADLQRAATKIQAGYRGYKVRRGLRHRGPTEDSS